MQPIPAPIMDEHLFGLRLPLQLGLIWEKQYEDKANVSVQPELDKAGQRVENIKNAIAMNKMARTNHNRTQYASNFDPDHFNARLKELTQEQATLQRELAEAERERARYQQLFESEQSFKKIAADKDTIMELFGKLQALPIEQKRRLLHGLVDGDIEVKPPSPEDTLDISEEANALNGWTKIKWKYNLSIIQEVLGVKILDVYETTEDASGWCWILLQGSRFFSDNTAEVLYLIREP
jgi:hypothetical protein